MFANKKVKNYKIQTQQRLGYGRYGTVYKCINQKSQIFAIKVMPLSRTDDEFRQQKQIRVQRQKDIMLSFNHKNIVQVYDYILSEHHHYMIMQLCQKDLRKIIKTNKEKNTYLQQSIAINYLTQILNGYKLMYNRCIMHRDLKPENILVSKDLIKIGDFGIAKIYEIQNLQHTMDVGTMNYAAPQVFYSKYDYKCDIWSIGIIYYQLLHNQRPFRCHISQLKKQRPQINYRKDLSKNSIDFIQKCLQVNPQKRAGFNQMVYHPILNSYFQNNIESFVELIIRQLYNSIIASDIIKKQVNCLLTQRQCKQKQMCLQQFEILMSQISEFMDKTKSKIVFDQYKNIDEKVSVLTIRKLLGLVVDKGSQKQIILNKSQSEA